MLKLVIIYLGYCLLFAFLIEIKLRLLQPYSWMDENLEQLYTDKKLRVLVVLVSSILWFILVPVSIFEMYKDSKEDM